MSQAKIEAFKKDFEDLCKDYNIKIDLNFTDEYIHNKQYKTIKLIGRCKNEEFIILDKEI